MPPPKTNTKSYIPLGAVIAEGRFNANKSIVEIKNEKLYVDDREVNSFLLKPDGFVIIKAQHYTSREKASAIRTLRKFAPTEDDNYAYFLEDGFYSLTKNEIRQISGANSAEIKFEVEFSVEAKFVWLKIEKNKPVKFAIEYGVNSNEIIGGIYLDRISD